MFVRIYRIYHSFRFLVGVVIALYGTASAAIFYDCATARCFCQTVSEFDLVTRSVTVIQKDASKLLHVDSWGQLPLETWILFCTKRNWFSVADVVLGLRALHLNQNQSSSTLARVDLDLILAGAFESSSTLVFLLAAVAFRLLRV